MLFLKSTFRSLKSKLETLVNMGPVHFIYHKRTTITMISFTLTKLIKYKKYKVSAFIRQGNKHIMEHLLFYYWLHDIQSRWKGNALDRFAHEFPFHASDLFWRLFFPKRWSSDCFFFPTSLLRPVHAKLRSLKGNVCVNNAKDRGKGDAKQQGTNQVYAEKHVHNLNGPWKASDGVSGKPQFSVWHNFKTPRYLKTLRQLPWFQMYKTID